MSDRRLWCLTHGQYLSDCTLMDFGVLDSRGKITTCRWVEEANE